MIITTASRAAGGLVLVALVFLTLGPPQLRPQTGMEHHLEHFSAFVLLGLMLGLGYPGRRGVLALLGLAAVALLELSQLWAPGRHATISDAVMNGAGLLAGLAATAAMHRIRCGRGDVRAAVHEWPRSLHSGERSR